MSGDLASPIIEVMAHFLASSQLSASADSTIYWEGGSRQYCQSLHLIRVLLPLLQRHLNSPWSTHTPRDWVFNFSWPLVLGNNPIHYLAINQFITVFRDQEKHLTRAKSTQQTSPPSFPHKGQAVEALIWHPPYGILSYCYLQFWVSAGWLAEGWPNPIQRGLSPNVLTSTWCLQWALVDSMRLLIS